HRHRRRRGRGLPGGGRLRRGGLAARDEGRGRRLGPTRQYLELPPRQQQRQRRHQQQPGRGERQEDVTPVRGLAAQQALEAEGGREHQRRAQREKDEPGGGGHLSAPSGRRRR